MLNPVPAVVSGVKAPISWARARPIVFGLFVAVVVVLAIKYAGPILAFVARAPGGGRVVKFATNAR